MLKPTEIQDIVAKLGYAIKQNQRIKAMAEHGIGGAGAAMFGSLMVVATVAVIVAHRARTAEVLSALGGGVATSLEAAVSPVTGGSSQGAHSAFITSIPGT